MCLKDELTKREMQKKEHDDRSDGPQLESLNSADYDPKFNRNNKNMTVKREMSKILRKAMTKHSKSLNLDE